MSQSVQQYGSVTFLVVAVSDTTMNYQWRKNGVDIPGATQSSYYIGSVVASDAGAYSVYIVNSGGNATSSDAILTVYVPAGITTQPQSRLVVNGQNATFSVVASGTSPFTYQWRFNGNALSGATRSTLTITNAHPGDAGSYTVLVANSWGSTLSAVATLSVGNPPSINTQPQSQAILKGNDANFSVSASGTATLKYQWRFNGAAISGATKSSLTINSPSSGGNVTVVVTNNYGSVTSSVATLTVVKKVELDSQPVSQTVLQGSSAFFQVTAQGTGPLKYQWSFNGAAISGATNQNLVVNNAQLINAGSYSVVVSNDLSSDTSTSATLTVVFPVQVDLPPQSQAVTQGRTASLSVVAEGTGPLSYQWNFNGAALPGATNSALALTNVQPGDAGSYAVFISNPWSSTTSAAAMLTVASPVIVTPPSLGSGAINAAGFTFQLSGSPGTTYVILASSNLTDWTPISTNVASSATITFTDPAAFSYPARFYRALVQQSAGNLGL